MISALSNEFLTIRAWHRSVVGDTNLILCFTSALEHHELFHGYFHEKKIDVYSLEAGRYENINYHIVNAFEGIEYEKIGNVFCTTISQTFNDMLANYDWIDELSLI
jgi:hypothetical protein